MEEVKRPRRRAFGIIVLIFLSLASVYAGVTQERRTALTRAVAEIDSPNRPPGPSNSLFFPSDSNSRPAEHLRSISKPALPEKSLDVSLPKQTGRTIPVNQGGDLESAIAHATCGDTIMLQAGATFTGSYVLPNKSCSGWVIIESSQVSQLPAGTRITPAQAPLLAKIESRSQGEAPIQVRAGAHHYRLIGLEVTSVSQMRQYALLNFDASGGILQSQSNVAQEPHYITVDRCYIHGDSATTIRRAISFQVAYGAVIDSYINEIHESGADSQAIAVWNGEGPFLYRNNYLSAAGENIIWGGADPAIPNLVPSDITVEGNHIIKNTAWRGDPHNWSVKNLIEFKNARRALITGNIVEYCWAQSQVGFAMLFTPRNQSGGCPWCTVEDVTFTNNIVRHSASGVEIAGGDSEAGRSLPSSHILIQNNVFDDINGPAWGGGDGRLFEIIAAPGAGSPHDITIDHNDGFENATAITLGGLDLGAGVSFGHVVITNNIMNYGGYGIWGFIKNGGHGGTAAVLDYLPESTVSHNVFIGSSEGVAYPPTTYFVARLSQIGFRDSSVGDYTLSEKSPYRRKVGEDADIGVDMTELRKATRAVAVP